MDASRLLVNAQGWGSNGGAQEGGIAIGSGSWAYRDAQKQFLTVHWEVAGLNARATQSCM